MSVGQPATAPALAPSSAAASSASTAPIFADLDRLQAAAAQSNVDLGHMRIEKWKADSSSKQQAQANADSVQRNLTTALPALIANVRAAPLDVSAEFKLYRNLSALYDVFASLTESAGAFGPRSDYDSLARQLGVIDSVRRDLGDELEKLTASTQSELNQLRTQVRTLKQQSAASSPPKKVIVDDTAPAKTSASHKKKPNPSTKSTDSSGSGQGPAGGSSAPVTKQQ
jgi:hypothetical protein